jgi:hypothetical protein
MLVYFEHTTPSESAGRVHYLRNLPLCLTQNILESLTCYFFYMPYNIGVNKEIGELQFLRE